MPNKLSRRRFLQLSSGKNADPITDDELFKKYSRKKGGHRSYSTELRQITPTELEGNDIRVTNVTSGLAPYTGTWSTWEVLHLLRRTHFGWKKNMVDSLLAMTPANAVDSIVQATPNPAPPINNYQNQVPDEANIAYGADWTNSFFSTGGTNTDNQRQRSLAAWWFGLFINQSNISIQEKMTLFLYHFIPVDFVAVRNSGFPSAGNNSSRICYRYYTLLRSFALGNFKTFIRQMCTAPAMMYYLNNHANTATAPDENFARELMELFTLGKDPASQYTQADVVSASKVLSGWRVTNLNTANESTVFQSSLHAQSNKSFSAFFNNTVINNQAGAAGANELDQLINMIFSKPVVVSQYICRRLYRFFVYYDIDSNIEANVIVPLAQLFVSSNWELAPVIKRLLGSQHFFDMANRGVFIKPPFDLIAGTINMFNVPTAGDAGNHEQQYNIWNELNVTRGLAMEQKTGDVPNVSGWPAFYQEPSFHQYWINTNSTQQRFRFLQNLIDGYLVSTKRLKIDGIAFVRQFPNATVSDPNALVNLMISYLLPIDLSAAKKQEIKQSTLLNNQITDNYWTTAWQNYITTPTNASYLNIVDARLKSLISTLIQLAEFQLM